MKISEIMDSNLRETTDNLENWVQADEVQEGEEAISQAYADTLLRYMALQQGNRLSGQRGVQNSKEATSLHD